MFPFDIIENVVATCIQLTERRNSGLSRAYGWPTALFLFIAFGRSSNEYERIQISILGGGDREALLFRQSITDECNMTAIAVRLKTLTLEKAWLMMCLDRVPSYHRWQLLQSISRSLAKPTGSPAPYFTVPS